SGGGVADRGALVFEQPDRVVGVREDDALAFDAVGLAQERGEVVGRIQVAEGFGEGARGEGREGGGVFDGGAADFNAHPVAPTPALPRKRRREQKRAGYGS